MLRKRRLREKLAEALGWPLGTQPADSDIFALIARMRREVAAARLGATGVPPYKKGQLVYAWDTDDEIWCAGVVEFLVDSWSAEQYGYIAVRCTDGHLRVRPPHQVSPMLEAVAATTTGTSTGVARIGRPGSTSTSGRF